MSYFSSILPFCCLSQGHVRASNYLCIARGQQVQLKRPRSLYTMPSIPLKIESPASCSPLANRHAVFPPAAIKLSYAIVLYRFFDINAYVYLENAASLLKPCKSDEDDLHNDHANGNKNGPAGPRAYLVKYRAEISRTASVLSALHSQPRDAEAGVDMSRDLPVLQSISDPSEGDFRQAASYTLLVDLASSPSSKGSDKDASDTKCEVSRRLFAIPV